MTLDELIAIFDRDEEDDAGPVVKRLSERDDLNVFLILDSLVPGNRDIISCAEHDEYYLGIDPEELAKVATEQDILDLIACGVIYDDESESMMMFA